MSQERKFNAYFIFDKNLYLKNRRFWGILIFLSMITQSFFGNFPVAFPYQRKLYFFEFLSYTRFYYVTANFEGIIDVVLLLLASC